MNNEKRPVSENDDWFIQNVKNAFEQQPLADDSKAREWILHVVQEHASVDERRPAVVGRSQHWMPSLIALAAVIGMAIFFFGLFSNEEEARVSDRDLDSTTAEDRLDSNESIPDKTQLAVEVAPHETNHEPASEPENHKSFGEAAPKNGDKAADGKISGKSETEAVIEQTRTDGIEPKKNIDTWIEDVVQGSENQPSPTDLLDKEFSDLDQGMESPKSVSSTRLIEMVKAANAFLTGKVSQPQEWLLHLESDFDFDVSGLRSSMEMLGAPKSVQSVRLSVDPSLSWASSPTQYAVTYRFDTGSLLRDVQRVVDAHFDAAVYEDVLDAIRDDPNGPRVDLRKEFFPRLRGKMLLVVSPASERSDREEFMMVLPVDDTKAVWSLVDKAHRKEPGSRSGSYRSLPMWKNTTDEQRPIVWCMADSNLVIGQPLTVQAAVDRWLSP